MTIDEVLEWIAKQNVALFESMQASVKNDEQWERFKGGCDILHKLRLHILMKTNPHNREDIKRINEREHE